MQSQAWFRSSIRLKFDSAQLLQHVPQTSPYLVRRNVKIFQVQTMQSTIHIIASSNLDAKVFSANSKIFTSCNCSFAIAHAFEETKWVGKNRHSVTLVCPTKTYTKIPPHVKKNETGTLASWGPSVSLWGQMKHLCIIRFIMLCISLGSAAVFDQVLIETCSNSCKCWTEGSSDSDAMMKLKSVSYYSKVLVIFNWYMITSSTAQGGGGSFKNRKSIGQIACCESWMSEQKHWLTDQLANWLSD